MKKLAIYSFLLLSLTFLWGCEKGNNYPGGQLSPVMALYDIRNLYKGSDVTLTNENLISAKQIGVVVVSDHSGGNMPPGLLVVQDSRRLSQLRGISIPIGDAAANYVPGDSVLINVEGAVLKRINGILQLTGVSPSGITKVASNVNIPLNRVQSRLILANPEKYESTLITIVKGGFNPLPTPGDVLEGEKVLNDGFGELTLKTEAAAEFANTAAPFNANYFGIVFNSIDAKDSLIPKFRPRTSEDIIVLGSEVTVTPVIITGFMSDLDGGDGNYEYVQLRATQDIDFAVTPYAVVVTNNANTSTPTGAPIKGWATGSKRTFKFSLSSGSVAKGEFFYVGGAGKRINGSKSTSISSAKWIRAFDYTKVNGDGFGDMTGGLFANSGNASGVAVFADSNVTVDSRPVDVIFVSNGGSLYTAGPPERGYFIANTDWYDAINPITLQSQPYYLSGSNTLNLSYNSGQGFFNLLGGEYNMTLSKWTKARSQTALKLTNESVLTDIEGEGATVLK